MPSRAICWNSFRASEASSTNISGGCRAVYHHRPACPRPAPLIPCSYCASAGRLFPPNHIFGFAVLLDRPAVSGRALGSVGEWPVCQAVRRRRRGHPRPHSPFGRAPSAELPERAASSDAGLPDAATLSATILKPGQPAITGSPIADNSILSVRRKEIFSCPRIRRHAEGLARAAQRAPEPRASPKGEHGEEPPLASPEHGGIYPH